MKPNGEVDAAPAATPGRLVLPARRLVRYSLRLLLKRSGLRPWRVRLRHLGLRAEDGFLASYPRSGSTWLRFLLFQVLTGETSEFALVNRALPYVGQHSAAPPLLPSGGRLIKTHEPYLDTYRKAVYVIRDVRDVVRSEHRFQLMHGYYRNDFPRFLDDFLAGRVHGLGSWADHVLSWLDSGLAKQGRLLVVRFEDLQTRTEPVLAEVARFLGLMPDGEQLRSVIEDNTIERMKQKEDRAEMRKVRPGLRHVHHGAVGGWHQALTETQVKAIEERTGPVLSRLGYPSAGQRTRSS